jgi:hypothetical protein
MSGIFNMNIFSLVITFTLCTNNHDNVPQGHSFEIKVNMMEFLLQQVA